MAPFTMGMDLASLEWFFLPPGKSFEMMKFDDGTFEKDGLYYPRWEHFWRIIPYSILILCIRYVVEK